MTVKTTRPLDMIGVDLMTNLLRCSLDPAFDKIVDRILLQLDGFSISSFLSVNKEWNLFLEEKLKYSNLSSKLNSKLRCQWMTMEPSRTDLTVAMGVQHLACDDKVLVTADDDTVQVRNVKTGVIKEFVVNAISKKVNCLQNKTKSQSIKEIFISDSIIGAVCYPRKYLSKTSKIFGFVYIWSKKNFCLIDKLKFKLLGDDQSGEKQTNHKMKVAKDKLVMVQQEEQRNGSIYWHPMGKKLFFHIWDVKNSSKVLEETIIPVEHTGELFTPARDIQIDHDGQMLAFSTSLESNVFDMQSGTMLFKINMLDPKVNRRNSDDVLLNMKVRRTVIRYPLVIIDCEHRYTGMGRIFVFNLVEKKTISHHAWDEQDYAITDDFTIRADEGSKYDLNVYASDINDIFTKIDEMKFVIQDKNDSLKLDNRSIDSVQREMVVKLGHQMKFCANKTSIITLSQTIEGNYLCILNFWLNKT